MALAASHAAMAAPLQGLTEISLGVLLVLGLLTRPAELDDAWVDRTTTLLLKGISA